MKTLWLLLSFLLLLAACDDEDADSGFEISIPVSVNEVKPQPIEEYITTSSTVYAIKEARLLTEVAGNYQLQINPRTGKVYQVGNSVKAGTAIVKIENPEYENNIKIDAQKLNLDISQREFDKQKSLYEKGGVTLRELKNTERTLIEARYSYENAKIQLDKLIISAPFDASITELPYHTPGTRIEAGQPVVQMQDYRVLFGEVNFPASELERVKTGVKIRVMHYNTPGDTLSGEIKSVGPALNPETRSFPARFEVKNSDLKLRPGMLVRLDAIVASKDSALVIPRDIIISKRRGKTVFIVEKGAASERTISTGLENADEVEVINGLKKGERLVVSGYETLRDGSKIKIVK